MGAQEAFASMEGICNVTAKGALAAAMFANAVVPGMMPLTEEIFRNQCNPATIMKVGATWMELADRCGDAANDVKAQLDAHNDDDWNTSDAKAFKEHAEQYQKELEATQSFAFAVGMVLIAEGAALLAVITYMAWAAACLAVMAAQIIAELAGVLTAPAAGATEAAATAYAAVALGTLESVAMPATAISNAGAAMIGLGVAGDVFQQWKAGNNDAFGSLTKGLVDGVPKLAQGIANLLERDMMVPHVGMGSPLGNIYAGATNLLPTPWDNTHPDQGGFGGDWGGDKGAFGTGSVTDLPGHIMGLF